MSKLRTRLRAWLLGTWQPPPGVWARVAVAADGTLLVVLAAGRVRGGVTIPPESPVWFDPSVFDALEFMAARMLDLAAARSGADDLRVAAAMEMAGEAFAAGVERAARTAVVIPVSKVTR